jgi:predicted phage baseplate assembly protein
MTDSVSRQRLPVPLAYRQADRAQVLAKLIHELVQGTPTKAAMALKTKSRSDPTVALLDAWATIADVIDFYQERIATESYLTTATEPESVLALAALLGYRPRPGLAATCWLAYTLVPDPTDTAVLMPKHQMVQSIPGAGELPQTFETTDDLIARPSWNTLPVKTTAPLQIVTGDPNAQTYRMPAQFIVAGAIPPLKPNDVVLITPTQSLQSSSDCLVLRASNVTSDVIAKKTTVTLQTTATPQQMALQSTAATQQQPPNNLIDAMDSLIDPLTRPPSTPPATGIDIQRDPVKIFPRDARAGLPDISAKVLTALHPGLAKALYPALASSTIGAPQVNSVQALRATTVPFGVQIPPRPKFDNQGQPLTPQEWPLNDNQTLRIALDPDVTAAMISDRVLPSFLQASVRFDAVIQDGDTDSSYHDAVTIRDATTPTHLTSGAGSITLSSPDTGPPVVAVAAPPPPGNVLELTDPAAGLDGVSVTLTEDPNNDPQVTVHAPGAGDDVTVGIDVTGTTTSAASRGIYVTVGIPPQFTPRGPLRLVIEVVTALAVSSESPTVLELNERRDDILAGSYVMIEDGSQAPVASAVTQLNPRGDSQFSYPIVTQVQSASPTVVNRYGMSMTVTRLKLASNWIDKGKRLLSDVRNLVVHALSVPLDLMEVPWDAPVSGQTVEVDGLYPGLDTGHRLVLTGTRADPALGDATVQAGEAIMVAGVSAPADPSHTGQTPCTTLRLATPLAYTYRRDTVTLYGNVVPAHHGATITETPTPAGNPANPVFTLAQSPVLADPSGTEAGFASSLQLVIDGRTWTWVPRLDDNTPARSYTTGTDNQGRTTITLGQPLPHPASTVTAKYRAGIGSAGNVRAGQLSQPLTRPLAVAKVTNPLPASGGADPDGPDTVRTGAPRGLQALGRVVSVQDAADIALSWAGIGKATATLGGDGNRDTPIVAVAGLSPTPLDPGSTLITDLTAALAAAGEIAVPIKVVPAASTLIVLDMQIRHDPDNSWRTIEPAVRTELTDTYGYDHRDIDEDIVISDLIAIVHRVDGVRSCTITGIAQIPYDSEASNIATLSLEPPASSGRIPVEGSALPSSGSPPPAPVPAVGYISAAVADTLILRELTDDHT